MTWRKHVPIPAAALLLLGFAAQGMLPCGVSFMPILFYSGFDQGNTEGFIPYPMDAWGPGNNDSAYEVQDVGCDLWAMSWMSTGFQWSDYILSASMQFKEGTCNNLGLIFRFQNPDNYYRFFLSDGTTATLECVQGGVVTRSESAPYAYGPDYWHVLRVELEGSSCVAVVNTETVLTWDDATFLTGTGGVTAKGTRAWFDNTISLIANNPPLAQGPEHGDSLNP
ncbi:MAG: hypothetical protein GF355_09085 [Candidatus Eisenbacteria bacterium]|nr:hypothetical protein [Candidatus Eisenbacteria bacterium]